jgi:hypothetical protein
MYRRRHRKVIYIERPVIFGDRILDSRASAAATDIFLPPRLIYFSIWLRRRRQFMGTSFRVPRPMCRCQSISNTHRTTLHRRPIMSFTTTSANTVVVNNARPIRFLITVRAGRAELFFPAGSVTCKLRTHAAATESSQLPTPASSGPALSGAGIAGARLLLCWRPRFHALARSKAIPIQNTESRNTPAHRQIPAPERHLRRSAVSRRPRPPTRQQFRLRSKAKQLVPDSKSGPAKSARANSFAHAWAKQLRPRLKAGPATADAHANGFAARLGKTARPRLQSGSSRCQRQHANSYRPRLGKNGSSPTPKSVSHCQRPRQLRLRRAETARPDSNRSATAGARASSFAAPGQSSLSPTPKASQPLMTPTASPDNPR